MTQRQRPEDETRVPAMNDARWQDWAQPLHLFLANPQEWPAIEQWCRETRFGQIMLRHCLAWLDDQGLVRSFYRPSGKIVWVTSEYEEEAPIDPLV